MKAIGAGVLLLILTLACGIVEADANPLINKTRFESVYQRAMRGDPLAQFELASFYEKGQEGLAKNVSYAVSWYEESAHNGFQQALLRLKTLTKPD
jgi:TPR repeat protein